MKSAIKCGCFFLVTAFRHKEGLIRIKKKKQKADLSFAGWSFINSNPGKEVTEKKAF